jgi:hypothetical protein
MSSDATPAYMAPLSDAQYFVLWGIACIAMVFSLIGSLSIIFISRRKLHKIYHRLLFTISCVDVASSLICIFAPIMMNEATGYPLSQGNQATCTTIGFVILFGVMSKSFMSCYISIYFLLSIRYNCTDDRVYRYERLAYMIAFGVPLIYSTVGFLNQDFNPNEYRLCSLAKYPIGCNGDECIRGESSCKLDPNFSKEN